MSEQNKSKKVSYIRTGGWVIFTIGMLYFVFYVIFAMFPNTYIVSIWDFIIPLLVAFLGLILVFWSYVVANKIKITMTIKKT